MPTARLMHRATFEFPIGQLNPMGLRIPGPQIVEIFSAGKVSELRWEARAVIPGRPKPVPYTKLGSWPNESMAKHGVAKVFERMLEDWTTWAVPPESACARQISMAELKQNGNGWRWADPGDFTHIIHAATMLPNERIPRAACGEKIDVKLFVRNVGTVPPSCPKCNDVYQAEYVAKGRVKD